MFRRVAFALLCLPLPALAPNSAPQPVPFVSRIPVAEDVAYPGTITLRVDATDTRQRILKAEETIPVAKAGPMVLMMPKWLPGKHAARGEIEKLAGLVIRANGKLVPWTRDPVDVWAFHIDVPAGARRLDVAFQFLAATAGDQGRISVTPEIINLQWEQVSLYPAGYFTRRIPIQATVTYPDGWKAASGLPSRATGSTYAYQATTYDVLVDSPVFAGRHFQRWALSDRVGLNVVADSAAELAATPEQIAVHRALVEQSVKLFGAQHYDRYEFLLAISDDLGSIGLEHHRSSENGVALGYFTNWAQTPNRRDLLPHEYTHSWNGKFRRGADLWTPDFATPMRNSLMWVYEGQTQFWGYVLAARSGLLTKQEALDALANIAATLDNRPARRWRPLIDTTNDPIITARRPKGWLSWQRSEDYYNEGLLVWMEVDATLRRLSGGTKSLDDFARAFFGLTDGDYGEVTYTFDDVVAALNAIQPHDWKALLEKRLTETGAPAPLAGLTGNGYRLAYADAPTPWYVANQRGRKILDLTFSIGLTVSTSERGRITLVNWDGPAFKAGLIVGETIQSVNGLAYSDERLLAAIREAKGGKAPVTLVVRSGERFTTVAIDYAGGLRYPRLEKTAGGEAGLDRLLTAK